MKVYMSQRQKRIYRLCLFGALTIVLIVGAVCWYWQMTKLVPDEILLFNNREEEINFEIPFVKLSLRGDKESSPVSVSHAQEADGEIQFSMAEPVTLKTGNSGSIQAEAKLFGWIHCKNIRLDVKEETRIMPVGSSVGLYIHADGVMVLGTGKVQDQSGMTQTPCYEILQTGDYIYEVNGKSVATIQDVSSLIQKNGANKLVLSVNRGSNRIKVKINPVLAENGRYQIGAWLREDTEGIGTLTFVTPQNQFAALGHGITDADTGLLIKLQNGGLYKAGIDHVERGEAGAPGELVGSVRLGRQNRLGTISRNTSLGIVGNITSEQYKYQDNRAMAIGRKQEVRTGKASILCQLGEDVREYEVEIEKINISSEDNKGMEIHVTDPKLLGKAGGIVQGMSGAPLMQNGKCIGAVTHVFVRDVTRGYATFIENMF